MARGQTIGETRRGVHRLSIRDRCTRAQRAKTEEKPEKKQEESKRAKGSMGSRKKRVGWVRREDAKDENDARSSLGFPGARSFAEWSERIHARARARVVCVCVCVCGKGRSVAVNIGFGGNGVFCLQIRGMVEEGVVPEAG